MSERTVEAIRVCKRFDNIIAVNDVSLSISAGEFFSLLGPSGCGKTTLLRMIAGFEQPNSGQIIVNGQTMAGVPPHKRPVNMVFQSYALFPHLTVFENVAFGLKSTNSIASSEIGERANWALDLVRLRGLADRLPKQISGGQAQRVALARAIANRPAVLLLDEPLSALDLKIRQEMQEELARLQRELGITFVMVTHDQGEALALSDRLAVFCQGYLEQIGTPEEIYERPKTRFVADFIGRTNLLDGIVLGSREGYIQVQVKDSLCLWVKIDVNGSLPVVGAAVAVWVRTDSVSLLDAAFSQSNLKQAGEPINCFEARVRHRSYQGTFTDYTLDLNSGICLKASQAKNDERTFQPGDEVSVCLPAGSTFLLPTTCDKAAVPVA